MVATEKFYVYKLIDPQSGLPFYVGKGKGDRFKSHERAKDKIYYTATHNNKLLKNKINKVLQQSGYIRYQKHFVNDEQTAFNIEIALIAKYGRRDNNTGILCNMTSGGEGVAGHKRSEQWKQKQQRAAHKRCKPIDQYTLDGQFIQTWTNYKQVLQHFNTDAPSLNRCCNNKARSTAGYRWTWHDQPLQPWITIRKPHKPHVPHLPHTGKRVFQYTFEGNPIACFPSVSQAARQTMLSESAIRECCHSRANSAGGYLWSFDQDNIVPMDQTVFQYDFNGCFITGFASIKSASTQTGLTQTQIRNSLYTGNKGGMYYWRKEKVNYIDDLTWEHTTGKSVIQVDSNGNVVNQFPSAKQAIEQTAIKGVNNCLHGLAKTAGGYYWYYN